MKVIPSMVMSKCPERLLMMGNGDPCDPVKPEAGQRLVSSREAAKWLKQP